MCTNPNIAIDGSSGEIDRQVKERLASALSIYDLNSELIRQLQPTHIFTQTQCKVCAVSLDDVEKTMQAEIGISAQVVALEPYALDDVWADILRVALACDRRESGESLVNSLRMRMFEIERQANASLERTTVVAIEWFEPLMVAGNWVPELIAMANGHDLFGQAGHHSPFIGWERLVEADPEVIIALPCGFDLRRTRDEMYWLTERRGWDQLKAVRDRRVFVCDGNQFMNRPGPRLVESLQIFAEVLHPRLFPPKLEGIGWARF